MRIALLALLLLCVAPAFGDDTLDALAAMMAGTFESSAPDSPFADRRIRIVAPTIGEHVFYLQLNQNEAMDLYRQRILVLSRDEDQIITRAYALQMPETFVDANTDDFVEFGWDDLKPFLGEGCEQVWERTDEGFRGYVDPETCVIISSRTGKPRGIEAETVLTQKRMLLVERGYDPDGNQLFGTPQGEFLELDRMPAD